MKTYQQFFLDVLLHVCVQGGGICLEEPLRRITEQQAQPCGTAGPAVPAKGPSLQGHPPHTAGLEQHRLLVKPLIPPHDAFLVQGRVAFGSTGLPPSCASAQGTAGAAHSQ